MAKEVSSDGRLAKFFGIDSSKAHGDSQWTADSDAQFEVIGLGLGRTGTTSLREALNMLGFGPVHHGVEIYRRPDHRERVTEFMHWLNEHPQETRKPTDEVKKRLRTLFKGYRSTMDMPCCDMVPEMVATYPNAKFILSLRDTEEAWWKSWFESVGIHFDTGLRRYIYRTLISSVHLLRRMDDGTQEIRFRLLREYGSIGPHIYHEHNQHVRDLVPKGQLLEYNVKEGWGPLCAFLGVDVPDTPFPNLNEGAGIKAVYLGQQILGAVTWAFYVGLTGAACYLAVKPQAARSLVDWGLRSTGLRI
ncbi:hypothetical protein H2200_004028 [Cladophialophora chaetospira]|uniref:NAD dependent epimerase/dehydratase n=1 Tax=Cladophialophora chaetospira TaxID=386627 RepID=A0AA38XFJ3_9EURO|nr:hypothetical protein H2200_004028 [Cladophialophora chaetospira]